MRPFLLTPPAFLFGIGLALLATVPGRSNGADWKMVPGRLATRWAADVKPDRPHPEYPRPGLARPDWLNLNGMWDYAIEEAGADMPASWSGQILVPFPIESALSGVGARVGETKKLWYRRTFRVPADWAVKGIWLHFEGVDWETTVSVNGQSFPVHRGGYSPFAFDISKALRPGDADQELVVAVWDPCDRGTQPRGKQVTNPNSIWYTPTTGIWRTVWLEPVAERHVGDLVIVTDVGRSSVRITPRVANAKGNETVEVTIDGVSRGDDRQAIAPIQAKGKPNVAITLDLPQARNWSPEEPWLYDLRVKLTGPDGASDQVSSYFGMRSIHLEKDGAGIPRLMLNHKFVFQFGPLDQGFWPDGLYTAPSDEALRFDIEATKRLGFNMIRKHVKVEPRRWYYWCDKVGILVWQDMPSGDKSPPKGVKEIERSAESSRQFDAELREMIDALRNHPSIVMWVPFNEGWGQFDTKRVADLTRSIDPTRLVNAASGWNDVAGVGDVHDVHSYPGPAAPPAETDRAMVLGEYGGLGLPIRGHTWQDEKNWGYKSFTNALDLTKAYLELNDKLKPLIATPGLSAAVYTQTTDVEIEVNGLMTYDRAVVKMPESRIADANRSLWESTPKP